MVGEITAEVRTLTKPDPMEIGAAIERAATDVAPLFVTNGWEWSGKGVPTKDQIADRLRYLVRRLLEDDEMTYTGTGRLEVQRRCVDDGWEELVFTLELGSVCYETKPARKRFRLDGGHGDDDDEGCGRYRCEGR